MKQACKTRKGSLILSGVVSTTNLFNSGEALPIFGFSEKENKCTCAFDNVGPRQPKE